MTRREAWVTATVVFAIALAVRGIAAAAVAFPVPEYSAYYVGAARNVVEGRGLVTDAIWSYQLPPLTFPRPAFEIWLPLPSLIAVPFMALLGTGTHPSQIASVLMSSLVPVLTWRLAADLAVERGLPLFRGRTLAIGSGIVAAVYAPLAIFGALPDSTAPFTVFALVACILMERVARDPAGGRASDPRLLGLGAALGLAALTRNEAIWYAGVWVIVAIGVARSLRPDSVIRALVRLVVAPGMLAIAIYAPWAARQWATFGTPLPGQAVTNAFSRTGSDIFAWKDRPSFAAWLAQGPAKLLSDRAGAFGHDIVSTLVLPGIPIGPIGLIGLPWVLGSKVLRPLLLGSAVTFLTTTLLFPVATLSGTFMHAAGPVQVLLVISAVAAMDALVAWIGSRRRWGRGSAAMGSGILVVLAVPVLVLAVQVYAAMATTTERRYADLVTTTNAAGVPLAANGPVITDYPIWLAEAARVPTLALPDESPESVLDLARTFGARLLVVSAGGDRGRWPAVLNAGGAAAACFVPVPGASTPGGPDGSDSMLIYRIACP